MTFKTRVASYLLVPATAVTLAACAQLPHMPHLPQKPAPTQKQEIDAEERMVALQRQELDACVTAAKAAIDDAGAKGRLRSLYISFQDACRAKAYRQGGFATPKEKELCDITKEPFDVFFNKLYVEQKGWRKQLFEIKTPGTVANDYYREPSDENLARLKQLFDQFNRYYTGTPYTWYRYYNKYLFSRSRLDHFKKDWEDRYGEYVRAMRTPGRQDAALARRRAEAAYKRFKDDCKVNNLPYCCQMNAFYLSSSVDDFMQKEKLEREHAALREKHGRQKEVVIFIHGLGCNRDAWQKFPEMLHNEDIVDPSLKKYFKVYVFRYDTVEDAKSVEGFRKELTGFINDIIKMEGVPSVNIVGHSFGGVTTLKCLVHYLDEQVKGGADASPEGKAKQLVDGYLSGEFKRPVKRFIGCGPSFSGSEMANVMADIFDKEEPLYQRDIPILKGGVPMVGDVQVKENEIGSIINLTSFKRLDYERPLDPAVLAQFLPRDDAARLTESDTAKLNAMGVKVLTIIGNPFHITSPFAKTEDDGLVKCFSANLNHCYLADPNGARDIGYKGAAVRYVNNGHHQLIQVNDRNRPEYRYVVSFLNDRLIPQEDTDAERVVHFLVEARVHPSFIDPGKYPEMCFRQADKVYYGENEKYAVPRLDISVRDGGGLKTENASVARASTNVSTGVFFFEGHVADPAKPAQVVFLLQARGYKPKYVALKVEGGKVTYAPNLTLDKE